MAAAAVVVDVAAHGADAASTAAVERPQLTQPLTQREKESEVGGSESAFRPAPPNREIVSCRAVRACVRAVWMPCGIQAQNRLPVLSLFPLASPAFPFSLEESYSLFPVRPGET